MAFVDRRLFFLPKNVDVDPLFLDPCYASENARHSVNLTLLCTLYCVALVFIVVFVYRYTQWWELPVVRSLPFAYEEGYNDVTLIAI